MNFGLPGGMKAKRFYAHCRAQGISISEQDAATMRDQWIATFVEMQQHMTKVDKADSTIKTRKYYSSNGDDDDEDAEIQDAENGAPRIYSARAITGMFRNACTENSALNFQFQSLAACGAKEAGWELMKLGLGPRLVNFVHDEFLYKLWPDELTTVIPHVEAAMIRGMQKVVSDVKVGVETCVMLHWDKGAVPFEKIKWKDGMPEIAEPEFVANLLASLP